MKAAAAAAAAAMALCTIVLTLTIGCGTSNTPVMRGRNELVELGCGSCHTIPGVTAAHGLVGPSLTHFASRKLIAGQLPNNARNLVRWILDPPAVDPGTGMPDVGASPAIAADIAAYLETLR